MLVDSQITIMREIYYLEPRFFIGIFYTAN